MKVFDASLEELKFATDVINAVTDGFYGLETRIGVHVCHGNWSTQEDVLLYGPYEPLIPCLKRRDRFRRCCFRYRGTSGRGVEI